MSIRRAVTKELIRNDMTPATCGCSVDDVQDAVGQECTTPMMILEQPHVGTVMELVMSLRNEKRERKNIAHRLSGLLRVLANIRQKQETLLIDLSCSLDVSGPLNTSKLPMEPTGFVVLHVSELQHRGIPSRTLCELQIVSMAVMYYRLYRLSGDAQDARSCARYCDWLEAYVKCPDDYSVIVQKDLGLYLYPLKQTTDGIPHLPDWLQDGEGETV